MTWRKGESGNPKGRKPGLALKLTTELRAIVSKDAKEIVSSIIAAAKAGDVEARRVFARHFLPQTKWPTVFDLPPIDGPADIPGAVKAMLDAAAKDATCRKTMFALIYGTTWQPQTNCMPQMIWIRLD